MDPAHLFTSLLASAGEKHSVVELGVIILVPAILSFTLYRVARDRAQAGKSRAIAWLSLIPLLIGDWFGLTPLRDVTTESYRHFYYLTDRSVNLHYAAFIVPALCTLVLLGMLIHRTYRDRMER